MRCSNGWRAHWASTDWSPMSAYHQCGPHASRGGANQRLGQHLATNTIGHWSAVLTESDVLFAPARHPRSLRTNPQACTWPDGSGDAGGPRRTAMANLRASRAHPPEWQAPTLGEHTQSGVEEFGIEPA